MSYKKYQYVCTVSDYYICELSIQRFYNFTISNIWVDAKKCYMYFYCHLIISTCTTEKHGTTNASDIVLATKRYNRIEENNTIHSYAERLTKCIITTSGSYDSYVSVLS